ncbi:MAG: hypothetical protein RLZZ385_36 [Pseudomonadota bacterium]|jgi:general secretion pathway protein D
MMPSHWKRCAGFGGLLVLYGCQSTIPGTPAAGEIDNRHITTPAPVVASAIPEIVRPLPLVSPPQIEPPLELYSVVVQDVQIRELLFAMARDAAINVDVHNGVSGTISINAIDQTLPQLLERIARQADIRWRFERPDYLVVEPDLPFLRSYQVDYVNIARSSTTEVRVSSAIEEGAVGNTGSIDNNNSTSVLNQTSSNAFWQTLAANLADIIGAEDVDSGNIIVNSESGLVTVRASSRQHEDIQAYIDSVTSRSRYQVLIEATIVEVELNDRFQSGVDWSILGRDSGQVSFQQSLTGLNLDEAPTNILTIDKSAGADAITSTIRLLSQFGELTVLSSPRVMALNNQTAMLRVVDSRVYFTISVEPGQAATATSPFIPPVYYSTVHTVPVGFTMAVTPQISENDQVTLNVRPTISRIVRFVNDPSPALADADVVNAIPEIQIREIESILKVDSGQVAVLGGLMQDSLDRNSEGLPGASRLRGVGNLFRYQDDTAAKTELIIFIRPVVVRNASVDGDLRNYSEFLPTSQNLRGN